MKIRICKSEQSIRYRLANIECLIPVHRIHLDAALTISSQPEQVCTRSDIVATRIVSQVDAQCDLTVLQASSKLSKNSSDFIMSRTLLRLVDHDEAIEFIGVSRHSRSKEATYYWEDLLPPDTEAIDYRHKYNLADFVFNYAAYTIAWAGCWGLPAVHLEFPFDESPLHLQDYSIRRVRLSWDRFACSSYPNEWTENDCVIHHLFDVYFEIRFEFGERGIPPIPVLSSILSSLSYLADDINTDFLATLLSEFTRFPDYRDIYQCTLRGTARIRGVEGQFITQDYDRYWYEESPQGHSFQMDFSNLGNIREMKLELLLSKGEYHRPRHLVELEYDGDYGRWSFDDPTGYFGWPLYATVLNSKEWTPTKLADTLLRVIDNTVIQEIKQYMAEWYRDDEDEWKSKSDPRMSITDDVIGGNFDVDLPDTSILARWTKRCFTECCVEPYNIDSL